MAASAVFPPAFGVQVYANIKSALETSPTGIKLQALERLAELLWDDDKVVHALKAGIYEALLGNLRDKDTGCRQLASYCIGFMCRCKHGNDYVVAAASLSAFSDLLTDEDAGVRKNACEIMSQVARSQKGLKTVIEEPGLLVFLIKQVDGEEADEVKSALLEVLAVCFVSDAAYQASMKVGVVGEMKTCLDTANAATGGYLVQASVARCLEVLARREDGKEACVAAGIVAGLGLLLVHGNWTVREASTNAMMNMTNSLAGKVAALEADALRSCIKNIDDDNENIAAAALQCIANLAEHPNSRETGLFSNMDTMEALDRAEKRESALVNHGAKCAITKIEWRP